MPPETTGTRIGPAFLTLVAFSPARGLFWASGILAKRCQTSSVVDVVDPLGARNLTRSVEYKSGKGEVDNTLATLTYVKSSNSITTDAAYCRSNGSVSMLSGFQI